LFDNFWVANSEQELHRTTHYYTLTKTCSTHFPCNSRNSSLFFAWGLFGINRQKSWEYCDFS
jgi:hypothetical protein